MSAASGALLTDLYQLTMLHAYVRRSMGETAVFELFVRDLPPARGFLVAAGLEQALEYLATLRFTSEELAWVAREGRFDRAFVDYLARLRFSGDVHALPEGTVFFADEPILRVTAPLPEAQLVESRLLNLLHFQTLVASKAARAVLAAPGKLLVDFGMRRAHGAEAALLAARASYLAGLAGSATVLANLRFDIPVYGTMAHSFVQAHDDEAEAFAHFAADDREHAVHLLDTYDTEAAAAKVVALAREGVAVRGVRLDSGDLAEHARRVRRILDAGGLREVTIFASGNLDEGALRDLVASGAPIDGFGLGTRLVTSADAPYLDCAYKLVEYAGRPRRKRSEGKASWPGRKQVWRRHGDDGRMREDVLALEDDPQAGAPRPLPVAGRVPRTRRGRPRAAARAAPPPRARGHLSGDRRPGAPRARRDAGRAVSFRLTAPGDDWFAAPPPLAALDRGPMPARVGNVAFGTASWTDRSLLASRAFYPPAASTPERRLRYYARHFPVVEVDATYYALPSAAHARAWAARTPADFAVGVKAYAALTRHPLEPARLDRDLLGELPRELRRKRSVYADALPEAVLGELWRRFHAALEPLRAAGKLAYLLFQMPKWFTPSRASEAYLEQVPARLPGAPIAVEFREARWLGEARRERTLDFLRRGGFVYVSVDEPQGTRASVPPVAAATSDLLAVVRFHGRNAAAWDKPGVGTAERFGYAYREDELREWLPRIRHLAARTRQVHVLMNNCHRHYAVQNAKELAALLAEGA